MHKTVYAANFGSNVGLESATAGTYKNPAPEIPFAAVKALEIFVATYVSGPASATASMLASNLTIRPSSVASAPVAPASC